MDSKELMQKVKDEFDQHYGENYIETFYILQIIEAIDPDHPIHDAMEMAYAIQDEYYAVKAGLVSNW